MADKTTKNNTDGDQPMNIPIRAADGQYLSALHPKYLHTNSTSHTWPFSAVAELIDNAYDPDVNASQLFIDVGLSNGQHSLVFTDNGSGMLPDQLYKMVSFGFSDKKAVKDHLPVGQYGNGFKSGSMRLGKDCLVFTKTETRWSLGFVSQTYLEKIRSNTIIVPFVTWEPKKFSLQGAESGGAKSLREILAHSVVTTIPEIKNEFKQISGTTGTRIIISNLRKSAGGVKHELDFTTDSSDIRIPDDLLDTDESKYKREQRQDHIPASDNSLRAYCAILYLKPRMQIILRGKKVRTTVIAKSLAKTEVDYYKPVTLSGYAKQVKITFGFSQNKNHYGIMMYNKNRLIKPYVRVGHQLKPNALGVGVIGVIECDFLQPTHNKQDFDQSKAFRACMQGLGRKLNEYWQEKKGNVKSKSQNSQQQGAAEDSEVMLPDQKWAQCDNPKCLKWRLLPDATDLEALPDKWYCKDHPLEQWRSCDIPEQLEQEKDTATAQPYAKEVTKQLRKERDMKRKQTESTIKRASELQQIVEKKEKELEEEKRKRTQNEEKAKSHEEEIKRLKMELERSNSKSDNQTPTRTPSNSSTSGPSLRSSSRISGASSTRSAASSASKTPVALSTPSAPRPAAASTSSTPKASQPASASPATRTPTRAASANRPTVALNGSPATGGSIPSGSPSIAASPARPTRQSINQAIKVRLPFTTRRTSQSGTTPQNVQAGVPVTPKVEQGAKPAVMTGATSSASQKAVTTFITQQKANVNTTANSLLIKQGNKFPVVAGGSQQKPGTRVFHLVVTDPSKISANIAAITGNASNFSIRPGMPLTVVSSAGDAKPRPIPIVQSAAQGGAVPQIKGVNPQLKNTPSSRDIDQQLAQIGIDAIAAQSHQMLPSMAMSTLNPRPSAAISRPAGTTATPTNRQPSTPVGSTSAATTQKLPNGNVTPSSSTNRQDPSKHADNKRTIITENSDDDDDDDDLQIVEPTPTKKVKLEQTSENSSKRPLRNAANNQGQQPKVNGINKAENNTNVNTNNMKQERIEIPPDVLKTTDKDLIEDVNKVPTEALRGDLARRSQQLRDLRKSLCQLLGLLVPDLNLPRTDTMPLDDNAIDVLLRDVLDANKESKAM